MGASDPIRPIGVRRTPDPLGPVARVQPVRRRGARRTTEDERPRTTRTRATARSGTRTTPAGRTSTSARDPASPRGPRLSRVAPRAESAREAMRCFADLTGRARCFEPVLFEHVYRRHGVERRMVFCAEHSARYAAGAVSVAPVRAHPPAPPPLDRRRLDARQGYGWRPGCTLRLVARAEDTSRRRCDDLFAPARGRGGPPGRGRHAEPGPPRGAAGRGLRRRARARPAPAGRRRAAPAAPRRARLRAPGQGPLMERSEPDPDQDGCELEGQGQGGGTGGRRNESTTTSRTARGARTARGPRRVGRQARRRGALPAARPGQPPGPRPRTPERSQGPAAAGADDPGVQATIIVPLTAARAGDADAAGPRGARRRPGAPGHEVVIVDDASVGLEDAARARSTATSRSCALPHRSGFAAAATAGARAQRRGGRRAAARRAEVAPGCLAPARRARWRRPGLARRHRGDRPGAPDAAGRRARLARAATSRPRRCPPARRAAARDRRAVRAASPAAAASRRSRAARVAAAAGARAAGGARRRAPGERELELTIVIPDARRRRPSACAAASPPLQATTEVAHEIVVVDNGAPPQGFTAPVNAGLRAARGALRRRAATTTSSVLPGWWPPLRDALDAGAAVAFPLTVDGADAQRLRRLVLRALARDAGALRGARRASSSIPSCVVWYQDTDLLARLRAGRPPAGARRGVDDPPRPVGDRRQRRPGAARVDRRAGRAPTRAPSSASTAGPSPAPPARPARPAGQDAASSRPWADRRITAVVTGGDKEALRDHKPTSSRRETNVPSHPEQRRGLRRAPQPERDLGRDLEVDGAPVLAATASTARPTTPPASAISEKMRAQIRGLAQAQNATSRTASRWCRRRRATSTRSTRCCSASASWPCSTRTARSATDASPPIQSEVNQLASEIDAHRQLREVQRHHAAERGAARVTFQVGANDGESIAVSTDLASARTVGDVQRVAADATALSAIDAAITAVSTARAAFGAVQNRLEHTHGRHGGLPGEPDLGRVAASATWTWRTRWSSSPRTRSSSRPAPRCWPRPTRPRRASCASSGRASTQDRSAGRCDATGGPRAARLVVSQDRAPACRSPGR